MDWVEGHTLDAYVRSDAGTSASFLALADRWSAVIRELEESSIAHGDLQHGNILVSGGELKLVDYDGMFVPALRGLRSIELGHRSYQHPRRSETDFDERLDRFASLSIHLSLVAMAENPKLRDRCTDQHLLFERTDYLNPTSSEVFREVLGLSKLTAEIARALQTACLGSVGDTPRLLDLVAAPAPSRLPGWMQAGSGIPEPTHVAIEAPRTVSGGSTGRLNRAADSFKHVAKWVASPPRRASLSSPTALSRLPSLGKNLSEALGCGITAGFVVMLFTQAPVVALWIAGGVFVFKCGSKYFGQKGGTPATAPWRGPTFHPSTSQPPTQPVPRSSGGYRPPIGTSTGASAQGMVIASAIRTKYHRPTCEWVQKMSFRNQRSFPNGAAARAAGYRPCRSCRPD
ncbi:MAG: hypothetical protein IPG75_19785 [Gemmatimonadetes bacterium]|nr:hypothetical protein [Gemmatimonadota bacterium]